eukprot:Gb_07885 [translate_table: standard]
MGSKEGEVKVTTEYIDGTISSLHRQYIMFLVKIIIGQICCIVLIFSPMAVRVLVSWSATYGLIIYLTLKTLSSVLLLPLSYLLNKYRYDAALVALVVLCFYFAISSYLQDKECIAESVIIAATGVLSLSGFTFWSAIIERDLKPMTLTLCVFLVLLLLFRAMHVTFIIQGAGAVIFWSFTMVRALMSFSARDPHKRLEPVHFQISYYANSSLVVAGCLQALFRGAGKLLGFDA